MAPPPPKRLKRSSQLSVQSAIQSILQSDDELSDELPEGSDDENLSDEEEEEYEPGREDCDNEDDDNNEATIDESIVSDGSSTGESIEPTIRLWNWSKKDLPPQDRPTNKLSPKGPALAAKTPLSMFLAHFDVSLLERLVLESNRHRLALNRQHVIPVDVEEIKTFIGICMYMSVADLPFRRMYWAPGTKQPDVADNMTCNRFEEILSLLHFNDNELMKKRGEPGFDPVFKVRPIIDRLNYNFQELAEKENCVAIDEMMIPFKGRHSLKVYMVKKTKKWGYKVWVQGGQSGYVHKFIFAGDTLLKSKEEFFEKIGRAGQVVLLLSRDQPQDSFIFFDNYFASPDLLAELKERKLNATCTIRSNRTRQCPLMAQKDLKKKGRGGFDFRLDDSYNVLLCEWFDNKIVTMGSNCEGVNPTHVVQRYDRREKKHVSVPCPSLIKTYNDNMGGVDKADMLLALYRTHLKSKKWYKRIIFHLVDLCIVNSWLLYRASKQDCQMQLVYFKLFVAKGLIHSHTPPTAPRPVYNQLVSQPGRAVCDDVRFDRFDHFPPKMDVTFAQRCKFAGCKRKTKYLCRKCSVYLCIDSKDGDENCFFLYHHG